MTDPDKSQDQLLAELAELRRRVAEQDAQLERSRDTEAKQQRINDSLPVLVATAGLDGFYREVNAAFERMLGWSEQESLSRPFVEFIHPDDRAEAVETFARLKSGDTVIDFLDRHICKDGSHRWIRWTVIPVPGRDIVYGFGHDITEKKQAEDDRQRAEALLRQAHDELEQRVKERTAELTRANELLQAEVEQRRRSEEELAIFRRFAEASGLGFGMADMEGCITYVNPTLFRWSDEKTPGDCVGKPLAAYMPANYRERRETEILPALRQQGFWQGEETISLRDGRTIPAIFSVFPVQDESGNLLRTAIVITDTTELKRAEAALRQSYEELRTIDAGMIEGLLITDIETKRFVRVNASLCRMLGYSEEELLKAEIKDIHPAAEVPNDERRFQAAAEGRVSINEDRPVLRKDGSIFYADITGRRIVYAGRPCLLALFRDVTERRQAEEKLKAEQRALRRMVLASDHERRLITYELHDGAAQQLLGAMIYLQSQEIPSAWKSPKAESAYREGMEALRRASAEIRRVMNRLRTPVLDKFGLAAAIEDVVAQLRLAPAAPEIECCQDVRFQRLEPTLENSLFRIAQEALTNACRHSQSEKVQVKLTQRGDDVVLEVRDWGLGFDPQAVQENRFGLEGIRERSRILGGKLSIKSKPGEGTVVRVKFPVLEAADPV